MNMAVGTLDGGVTCIRLQGRLDTPGAGAIDLKFTSHVAAGEHGVVVDLSGVVYIASMGLRLLFAAARDLQRRGRVLVLFGASSQVQQVLDEAAIDQVIPIVATEAEALARLAA